MSLEAGPELDALIARRVMGLIKNGTVWSPHDDRSGITLDWAEHYELPHYSTEIAAAWQVVERLTAAHKTFHLWCSPLNGEWHVDTDADDGSDRTTGMWAESAPLAICRAALAASAR